LTTRIYTIGFAKKTAEQFFTKLRQSGAKRVVDVRLNNVSQLAGFTKKDDLRFFLRELCNMEYEHLPALAPTQEILGGYRKNKIDWRTYEEKFNALMTERKVELTVPRELIENGCLLCSEDEPHHCHRRLVAEYLKANWGGVEIIHL
jgi:uncharacterized protein (DUF488 family)